MKNSKTEKKKERPLWEGHRKRLRTRMEQEGWDALKPYEKVELVLYHAVPRQDLSNVSRLLVNHFGTVGGVFCASREELLKVDGMTPVLTEWILATGDLMRAYYDLHAQDGIRLNRYQKVFDFLLPRISQTGDATVWVMYADFKYDLITYSDFSALGNWWDPENVRRIVIEAVNTQARYVFFVRFMDHKDPDLGKEEMTHLESIAITLQAVEVEMVDCVLVGGGEMHSMNAENRMQNIRAASNHEDLHEKYVTPGV